ncbi:hypothetical protein GCM10010346_25630 [Streptomyces chryseus]|uniref:Uncharacterized protein n=1 Tax=Streptomyces chryseus TaxID=68186 RepID=A0ABQ3DM59_9ACTN|nr:hypothetical protein GCM10010346_25630 [Streptomyces chryseus]
MDLRMRGSCGGGDEGGRVGGRPGRGGLTTPDGRSACGRDDGRPAVVQRAATGRPGPSRRHRVERRVDHTGDPEPRMQQWRARAARW